MARSIYQGENYEYVYGLDNYIIEYNKKSREPQLCVIYCSSSGLYYPNTEEEFVKAFIDRNDKFEWKKNQIRKASKSIWIRDITKEFYVRGINSKINTIDKLIEFLKAETKGYEIITVGSSGGGYIATLLGCELKAKRVYCFSGFFNLNIIDKETWPLIKTYRSSEVHNKWYNLKGLIEGSGVKIFYFYPGKLQGDREQAAVVQGIKNVYMFNFDSEIHGVPFRDRFRIPVLKTFFSISEERMIELWKEFNTSKIKEGKWIIALFFIKMYKLKREK